MSALRIGVLALQGDFEAHVRKLARLGATAGEIRKPEQLAGLDGLILPGGESTALLKLMENNGFETALRDFHAAGKALFGTCAGMILLCRKTLSPAQRSLGLIDVDVERNAYGRQIDSFEALADWVSPKLAASGNARRPPAGAADQLRANARDMTGAGDLSLIFIRAPRLVRAGPSVEPLVRCRGDVVLAVQDNVLVGSFHPELGEDMRVHRCFLELASRPRLAPAPVHPG